VPYDIDTGKSVARRRRGDDHARPRPAVVTIDAIRMGRARPSDQEFPDTIAVLRVLGAFGSERSRIVLTAT
jgi:hypothetical protein